MSAGFKHWLKNERENILKLVCYVESGSQSRDGGWGKFSNDIELSVVKKIENNKKNIISYFTDTGQLVAISGGTGGYWLRAFDEIQASNEYKNRFVKDCETQLAICAVFNSTTFYWLWRKYSDCRHLTMVDNGKIFIDLNPDIGRKLKNLGYDHQRILKATKEELYKTTTVIMVIWPFVLAIAIGFNFIEDSLPEKPEPNDPERNQ